MYIRVMKYEWDPDENEWLKRERNISFEQTIFHLSQGNVWKIADHPNQEDYHGQRIYFVVVDGYVYMVPHIIQDEYIFLKTVIPAEQQQHF